VISVGTEALCKPGELSSALGVLTTYCAAAERCRFPDGKGNNDGWHFKSNISYKYVVNNPRFRLYKHRDFKRSDL
jgi:hypothetical protein